MTPGRTVKDMVEQILGEDGDAFGHITERRTMRNAQPAPFTGESISEIPVRPRARPTTMRLARLQTALLYGVEPER